MKKGITNRQVLEIIAEATGSKSIEKKLRNDDIMIEYYAQIKKGNKSGRAVKSIGNKYNLTTSQIYRIIKLNVK